MSDLVEKVHDAVGDYCIHTGEAVNGKCADCGRITRAAIAAVAEWLEAIDFSDADLAGEVARHYLRAELRAVGDGR